MHAMRTGSRPRTSGGSPAPSTRAGVDAIEVAHGDGLAGSSFNYGPGSNTDWEWIEAAAAVVTERPAHDPAAARASGPSHDLAHAYELGVRSVRVATHCTEADISAQHIAAARELGMDVVRLPDDVAHGRPGGARARRRS